MDKMPKFEDMHKRRVSMAGKEMMMKKKEMEKMHKERMERGEH